MNILSKWRSPNTFNEAVNLACDSRFHSWCDTEQLTAGQLAAIRMLIGIGAMDGKTRGILVDRPRIPRASFAALVRGRGWERRLHDLVFERTPHELSPFDGWTMFHEGIVNARMSPQTIGSEIDLKNRKNVKFWLREHWHVMQGPWVRVEPFDLITESVQVIASAQSVAAVNVNASPTINVSPIVQFNPEIKIEPTIQIATPSPTPTGQPDATDPALPTDGELFAYLAFNAAQDYIRRNQADPHLAVTQKDAYEVLRAELGKEIDRRSAGIPEWYELGGFGAFKKSLSRAKKKLSKGTRGTSRGQSEQI